MKRLIGLCVVSTSLLSSIQQSLLGENQFEGELLYQFVELVEEKADQRVSKRFYMKDDKVMIVEPYSLAPESGMKLVNVYDTASGKMVAFIEGEVSILFEDVYKADSVDVESLAIERTRDEVSDGFTITGINATMHVEAIKENDGRWSALWKTLPGYAELSLLVSDLHRLKPVSIRIEQPSVNRTLAIDLIESRERQLDDAEFEIPKRSEEQLHEKKRIERKLRREMQVE